MIQTKAVDVGRAIFTSSVSDFPRKMASEAYASDAIFFRSVPCDSVLVVLRQAWRNVFRCLDLLLVEHHALQCFFENVFLSDRLTINGTARNYRADTRRDFPMCFDKSLAKRGIEVQIGASILVEFRIGLIRD